MDQETNHANVAHKPPPLNSDQLNYLIWRYLQEAGYAEAAVKLQRDWKAEAENFAFAKHIKDHALIQLVQKGLKFHHLSLTFDENGQQTRPLTPSMFYFGPESANPESATVQKESLLKVPDLNRGVSPASTVATSLKPRPRDTASAAPEDTTPQAAKRGRKPAQSLTADRNGLTSRKVSGPSDSDAVNGTAQYQPDRTSPTTIENHAVSVGGPNGNHEDRMDLDNDVTREAADVTMEEQADDALPAVVPTLTNGQSRAVQVVPAKVANLTASSAILSLNMTQSLSRALWQPAETDMLVVQSDGFCGYWDLAGQDLHPGSVKPLPGSLFTSDEAGLITAAAWDSDGSILAVATFADGEGQIHLFEGQDLGFIESLPASQRAVTMLKWHTASARLVGISPDEHNEHEKKTPTSTLLCWNLTPGRGSAEPSILTLPSTILDVDFDSTRAEGELYAAGDGAVFCCRGPTEMKVEQQWTNSSPHMQELWTFVRCARSHDEDPVVIAAAAETASLWLPNKKILKHGVHQAPITALELRPRSSLANGSYPKLQFASSSDDGTIKVWDVADNGTDVSCLQQLRFDPVSPIMSLAYSPDGLCLAGAGYATVRIWNAQHDYSLMALWDGSEPEWRGSSIRDDELASSAGKTSTDGESPTSAQHSLSWHSDSKRLAFGLGSQVAVINFQR